MRFASDSTFKKKKKVVKTWNLCQLANNWFPYLADVWKQTEEELFWIKPCSDEILNDACVTLWPQQQVSGSRYERQEQFETREEKRSLVIHVTTVAKTAPQRLADLPRVKVGVAVMETVILSSAIYVICLFIVPLNHHSTHCYFPL